MNRYDKVHSYRLPVKVSEPGHPDNLHKRWVEVYQPVIQSEPEEPKIFGYQARISPNTEKGIVYWGLLSTEDEARVAYQMAIREYAEKIKQSQNSSSQPKPPKDPFFYPEEGHPSIDVAVAALTAHAERNGMALLKSS